MEIISRLFGKKKKANDRFLASWADMHLCQMFTGSHRKLYNLILVRLADTTSKLKSIETERFFAEMLGAQLNLFGFVCDRLNPELDSVIAQLVRDEYLDTLYGPYRFAVEEAFTACNEMAAGFATNPILGYRTIALAVATRLDILESPGAVKLLTEQFQKIENDWEEEFKIVLLDEYDAQDPARSARAAELKGKFRRHLLNHAIKDISARKGEHGQGSGKTNKPSLHVVR